MALSPQLLQFKSSGVYRLEFDKSQTSNINVETLRLVVGTSRKGPYNTPVLIDTVESFNDVFGGIDKNLEKKGMFFHRSAVEALSRGPILALNLGKMTPTTYDAGGVFLGGDTAHFQSVSTNGSLEGNKSNQDFDAYSEFFNTEKFWVPSDVNTLQTINGNNANEGNLLNFVNIKQQAITVITRQAANVAEFDMTAREWYGEGNVPSYLNELDRMSDYMLDVFVFKGEFNATALKNDPIYGDYFDEGGLLVEKLAEFANLRQITLLAQYTGSILPGFKDLEGRNLYIESIVNLEARRTGLFCAVDEDAVLDENGTKVDFVGHAIDADEDFEVLSHVVGQDVTVPHSITIGAGSVNVSGASSNQLAFTGVLQTEYNNANIDTDDFVDSLISNEYAKVDSVSAFTETNTGLIAGPVPAVPHVSVNTSAPGITTTANLAGDVIDITGITALAAANFAIGKFYSTDSGLTGNEIVNNTYVGGVLQLTFTSAIASPLPTTWDLYTSLYVAEVFSIGDFTITCLEAVAAPGATVSLYHVTNSRVIDLDFPSIGGTLLSQIAGSTNFDVQFATILTAPAIFPLSVGMYVDSAISGRIARISRIEKVVATTVTYKVYCDIEPAFANRLIKSFSTASDYYKTLVLPKASIAVKSITNYLSVLTGGYGLYDALIDKDIIDFRYVVDTFTSFSDGKIETKKNLSQLAKDRENAAAILNAPTVADFKASFDPSFKDANGTFKTQFIKTGGNLDQNPTFLYNLPSIAEGANYAFYYAPGLVVNDNGKDIVVPPAAYVANNYIDKYTNALPWSIVAGPRRGVVSGANVKGAEYSFDKNDRDILEPFGINPIVFQRGVGLTILGNKTAQQSIKSALSSAHVREVLIYIQDGMANILKDYVFEFNTVQTRLEIKTLADSFMESVKQDSGVYEFRNIMDQTNNTNEVIDNNMGIIDTYVEPVKGLEIVVHRTTILNTGEIQSGNLG
mgnify:FL=1|jgi:hypothetical protein|tara:strand:- start:903 stop:3809 length:2907 start_codon:yes stop_codon:yes gene_type:complete